MRISYWSSDVCSSDLNSPRFTKGSEGRRSSIPAAMESILAAYWIISSSAAITECPCCRSHRVTPRATEDGSLNVVERKGMRITTLLIAGAVSSAVAITAAFAQSESNDGAEAATTKTCYPAKYTESGDLILPENFHEWVYVRSEEQTSEPQSLMRNS